jgi:hypothetical protein
MTDPTMNGALRRSRLSHHLDDLVSGLALGADEILSSPGSAGEAAKV